MKIHFLPGLGFDCRIFQQIELPDYERVRLNWIEPAHQKETIQAYVQRLAQQMEIDSEPIILIGHSLGGILALEMSKIIPIEQVILLSSIKSRKELPLHFKIVQPLRLDRFFTSKMGIKTIRYWGKYHDYESAEEQALFKEMIGKQSDLYLKWALRQLSSWRTDEKFPTTIFQIHGNKDTAFPIKLIKKVDVIIPNAGHFMVYKKADILSKHLNEIISNYLEFFQTKSNPLEQA